METTLQTKREPTLNELVTMGVVDQVTVDVLRKQGFADERIAKFATKSAHANRPQGSTKKPTADRVQEIATQVANLLYNKAKVTTTVSDETETHVKVTITYGHQKRTSVLSKKDGCRAVRGFTDRFLETAVFAEAQLVAKAKAGKAAEAK